MKLSDKQREFARDIGYLMEYVNHSLLSHALVFEEARRNPSQQWLYYYGKMIANGRIVNDPAGRSTRTMDSRHLHKLAVDFTLFKNGIYQKETDDYRELGDYWKSLNSENVWGGDFGWDGNHFE